MKDTVTGFVYIHIVFYLLLDDLLSVWTWICVFQAGLLGDWWYLVPQHALDYSGLMGLFAVRLWLFQAIWPNYAPLRRTVIPKWSGIWLECPGMLVGLL